MDDPRRPGALNRKSRLEAMRKRSKPTRIEDRQDAMTDTNGQDAPTADGQTPPATARTEVSTLPSDVQDYIKRLNEENKTRRQENEKLVSDEQKRRDADLTEQKRWQELAETRGVKLEALENVQAHATDLEGTLQTVLDAQIADLPKEAQQAITDMPGTARQKLEWLAANKNTLTRVPAPDMHAGARGDSVTPGHTPTPMQKEMARAMGIPPGEFAKQVAEQGDISMFRFDEKEK